MTKLASEILNFKLSNKSADVHDILAAGYGESESEVEFILTQLEMFGYLEV